jgi:hypothetical protein
MKRTNPEPEPIAQLELISAELDRELSNISTRQANAVTRASIVLAAAGVTAFTVVSTSLGWSLVPAFFSLLSAFLCFEAIRYWKSKAVQIKRAQVSAFLTSTHYVLLWRQVIDKFEELDAARTDLDRKSNYLSGAVGMLILAWVSAAAIRFIIDPILSGSGY